MIGGWRRWGRGRCGGDRTVSKHHRGRWPGVEHLVGAFEEVVAAEGFDLLPLSVKHAIRAGAYGPEHPDPFDRMWERTFYVSDNWIFTPNGSPRSIWATLSVASRL